MKYGKVQMYCERDSETAITCIYRRLNGAGEYVLGTILYIRILFKIEDESFHGIENSRTSVSETRDCKLCVLPRILP